MRRTSSWPEELEQNQCKQVLVKRQARGSIPCWRPKDDGEIPRQQVVLEHVIRHRKGNMNCRSLERVAHACCKICGRHRPMSHSSAVSSQRQDKVHSFGACALLQVRMNVVQRPPIFTLETCQNRLVRRLLAMTRNWDCEQKKNSNLEQGGAPKAWSADGYGTQNSLSGLGQFRRYIEALFQISSKVTNSCVDFRNT